MASLTEPAGVTVGASRRLWTRVEELADRADSVADLWSHGLHLVAIRRWPELGRSVPTALAHAEMASALAQITAPVVLEKVRDSCQVPMILFKGPEIASLYPDPVLRPFGDLDLLVDDVDAARKALIAAGFEEIGDPEQLEPDHHHALPLKLKPFPLPVELHSRPNWPLWLESPPSDEFFAAARPSGAGYLTLPPAHHALVLAAHAWAHAPLGSLRDLLDIALVAADAQEEELDALAARWGLRGVWRTTRSAIAAVLFDGRSTWALRLWARNLEAVRERTVVEAHLENWISPFWALPRSRAARATGSALLAEVLPARNESWRTKARRAGTAVGHARWPKSAHDQSVGLIEVRRRRTRRRR